METTHATSTAALPNAGTSFRFVFANLDDANRFMRRANRAFWRAQRLDSLACRVDGPDDAFTICDYATAVGVGVPFTWSV